MSRTVEERLHTRVPLRMPALWAESGGPGDWLSGSAAELENVGERGLFLRAPRVAQPGARVAVWLAPDGVPAISVTGSIAWVSEDASGRGMGVRIDEDGPSLLAQLLCLN
jgi:hypothetical protein